jgi:alpha-1,3-glucosyltransferase
MMYFRSSWFEPESVALNSSRGYETLSHKIFMRATVIIVDVMLLFPSIWYTVNAFYMESSTSVKFGVFVALAAQPGLLLIDNGHFQYNNVSLALSILAMGLIFRNHDLLGSISFSLALMYKQMSLYYAPAFFFFLLAKKLRNGLNLQSLVSLAKVGIAVLSTFIACISPFLVQESPIEQIQQLIARVFPVGRGLYEDKVANLWCSISPVFKLQNFAPQTTVIRICLVATVVGMIPSAYALLRSFRRNAPPRDSIPNLNFVIGTSCIAWSFFFFSYHVHEKSVLLPILPMTLLFAKSPTLLLVANFVSTFSMIPLLQRDGHEYSLLILSFAYILFFGFTMRKEVSKLIVALAALPPVLSYAIIKLVTPPASYPDLFTLFLTACSFAILGLCWLVLHLQLFLIGTVPVTEAKKVKATKVD